ncbi:type IV secretion system protein [Snodgrassella sp. B3088]|uniref:type IV secretion system protein n=1 Tax=Snodgrassella sp. B3088 TaxID=2818038 RepID=UPI00226A84D5|nr:type IV secretion system protein [Snodgrassella sp. B3088]MCX8748645.1 type IV secretion system protein [Snodgrassella sp. B3088]
MKILNKWLSTIIGLILFVSSINVQASGIPVFDGAAAANMVQQIIQSKTQIDNQIEQITELKNQVAALSGSRNMGKILNSVKEQLPNEWQAIYGNASSTNYKDLLKGKDYTPEQAAKALFANYDATLKSFQDSKKRLDNIQALMTKINSTKDIKAAADLQSRISAEQAIIQNNQTKLDMMSKMFDLEEKIARTQRSQRDACLARHIADRNYSSCN